MAPQVTGPQSIRESYQRVRERIAETLERCGRKADDCLLVAVTSKAPPDAIRTLVEMGHLDLGETEPQQLAQRVVMLEEFLGRRRFLARPTRRDGNNAVPDKDAVRWHMLGSLGRNKAKAIAKWVRLFHQVDNLRMAEELHTVGAKIDQGEQPRPLEVMLQVNATGKAGQRGVTAPAIGPLAEQLDTMVHLRLRGLSVVTPAGTDPQEARRMYARAAELLEELRATRRGGGDLNLLSMGSSDDFETAIEEGANIVRIGRALFGAATATDAAPR